MTQAIPYILLASVLFGGFWLILHTQFRNEEKKRQWELKRESQKAISPIRLRAYERLALLLERTKPEHMLMELRQKEPDALVHWTVGQVQQYLLQTLRAEFDHNQSQQIYVSNEVWDVTRPNSFVHHFHCCADSAKCFRTGICYCSDDRLQFEWTDSNRKGFGDVERRS